MESSARPRRLWLRDPLAILADGAGGGLVVEGSRIAEVVAAGARPARPVDATFDASRHVVIPASSTRITTSSRRSPAPIRRRSTSRSSPG